MTDIDKEVLFIEYTDHAFHVGTPQEVVDNPYVLWAVGVVEFENDDFIALRWSGSLTHKQNYTSEAFEIIQKPLIIKRKVLKVIGDD